MSTIFSALLAVIQLIPTVEGWVQSFIAFYVVQQINSMKAENRDAIKKAFDEKDQRDLEKAIGNPAAGEPSGIPGTEHRDTLPGVPNPPAG
jgi:hypothetical protein